MPQDRFPLVNGAELAVGDEKYRILELMSDQGGSCLVYKAELLSETSSETKYVIKEFYPPPDEISTCDLQRGVDGKFIVAENSEERFNELKMKFSEGIATQIADLYMNPDCPTLGCPEGHIEENAAYSILELGRGETLKEIKVSDLSPSEIIQIMLSLCNAIGDFHSMGQLYLDVKPSNIFLFKKECEEKRKIALFDFDTVFEKDDLPENGPYSIGWAPYEQELWSADEITTGTDIYAIGGVFYWLLTGEKPDGELLTRIFYNDFSFLKNVNPAVKCVDTEELFRCALNRESHKRTKNIGRIIRILENIEKNVERRQNDG